MTSIAVGAMSRRERSCKRSRSHTSEILSCGPEIGRASEHEIVRVGRQSVHQGRGDPPVLFDVRVERGELLQVLDENRRGGAHVEAKVHKPCFRRRDRSVVVDYRENLVVARVGEVGVHLVRVDQAQEIDPPHFADALYLPKLEPEQLHERPVLAVAELVAIADGALPDAEALREVRLGNGTRDPIGVWCSSKGNQHVLRSSRSQRICKGSSARLGAVRLQVRRRQSSDRFGHGGRNCGHVFAD